VGEVHCTGSETELLECSHNSIGHHFCGGLTADADDVAIGCAGCEDGDVRLQGGIDSSNGRVEFCKFGVWGAVCSDEWDDNDARVVCGQLGYDPEDAKATQVFGGVDGPAFLSGVRCTGSEEELTACSDGGTGDEGCASAGVTCGKSTNVGRCKDEPTQTIGMDERFGKCEAYTGGIQVCDGLVRHALDHIYIPASYGTQSNISTILNSKIQMSHELFATHDKDCVDQVFRVMCRYYLPPCGNFTHPLPPSSICQEECAQVQSKCQETWQTARVLLTPYPFINCDDTSELLFPLPNCCTGAGILTATGEEASSSMVPLLPTTTHVAISPRGSIDGGTVAGAVVGILVFLALLAVVVVVVLLVINSRTRHRRKQMEKIQLDILGMADSVHPIVESTLHEATSDREAEPDENNVLSEASATVDPNQYLETHPITEGHMSASALSIDSRTRVNSRYLREMTLGKFIIKYENVVQLENIGQGEFGIVYRARLGPQGREVAVKTLKGDFDDVDVDQFVEESLKMSRFKHAHVMGLIGVCLDAGSAPYIVMPYMANGSLLKYLKKERKNLVFTDDADEDEVLEVRKRLMVMCSQIASGMEYLASEKYIHRDLAARNCMIDSHFLIKITDFGLSEDVFVRNYYRQGSGEEVVKLPVKWMAPESLSDGHFSEKSDVWSYGVTVWEIFSGGKSPYPATNPLTLLRMLEEGERMPKPYNAACSEEIYMMMMTCWELMAEDRPSFKELHKKTSKYIERIAGYLEMGFNPFTGMGFTKAEEVQSSVDKMNKVEEEQEMAPPVVTRDTPISGEISAENNIFTNTTD
jgi:c-mer proto-oncogene tyrosine kinase/anaplastic lymphoma kinase/receptor tyrosine kinase